MYIAIPNLSIRIATVVAKCALWEITTTCNLYLSSSRHKSQACGQCCQVTNVNPCTMGS